VEGPGGKEKAPGRKKKRLALVVSKGNIRTMPSQLFCVRPTAGDIDQLVALLPQRTFRFGKRSVTFLICAEILAFNPDGTAKHRRWKRLTHPVRHAQRASSSPPMAQPAAVVSVQIPVRKSHSL
ncbi:MAG: hypothetical protein ACXWAV_07825, partial [Chthoniobacterales bacterium]